MSKFNKADFGKEVEDKITGFTGTIIGISSYITGCDQILVQPAFKKNEWKESRWFDDDRIEPTGKKIDYTFTQGALRGGPDRGAPTK
jgi:hypothetical protein